MMPALAGGRRRRWGWDLPALGSAIGGDRSSRRLAGERFASKARGPVGLFLTRGGRGLLGKVRSRRRPGENGGGGISYGRRDSSRRGAICPRSPADPVVGVGGPARAIGRRPGAYCLTEAPGPTAPAATPALLESTIGPNDRPPHPLIRTGSAPRRRRLRHSLCVAPARHGSDAVVHDVVASSAFPSLGVATVPNIPSQGRRGTTGPSPITPRTPLRGHWTAYHLPFEALFDAPSLRFGPLAALRHLPNRLHRPSQAP